MRKFFSDKEQKILMIIGNHYYLKELELSKSRSEAARSATNIINMMGIHDISIVDLFGVVRITLESPGILIGLKGSDIDKITKDMNDIIKGRKPYTIEIIECELNRYLLGFQIALQYSEDPEHL